MLDKKIKLAAIGEAGLALMPDSLRQSMLSDPEFLDNFGLSLNIDGTINFGNGPKFTFSELYNLVNKSESISKQLLINDNYGQEWVICIAINEQGHKFPRLIKDDKSIDWLEGALLLKDEDARQQAFQQMADNAALPGNARQHWEALLVNRPFTNTEMSHFLEDLDDTPIRFVNRLSYHLRSGEAPVELFIPRKRRYYERLVGNLGAATTLHEYAQGGATKHTEELVAWNKRDGLLLVLAMASHSELVSIIPLRDASKETAAELFNLLIDSGDMISRLGAIQAAIPLLCERPDLTTPVKKLIKLIVLEDPTMKTDGFSDLCRLFIFVESEISRLGVLRGVPPFYRRLASFAHTSLIQRQLLSEKFDLTDFRNWTDHNFGPQFYFQSLADMRSAPRWYPELINPVQLKQEFIGRLLGTGETFKEQIEKSNLTELISLKSESEGSLVSVADFPKPYFPGPLEGNLQPSQRIPDDMHAIIDEQLNESELSSKSFIAAMNFANVFMIEADLAERISELLKKGRYHLHRVDDAEELAAVLSGLAKIAAVTRSIELAQDVRILVHKYRSAQCLRISIRNAYCTLFFAAGAYAEIEDWCAFVGDSLRQLAFSSLTKDEAKELQALIRYICIAEPELWTTIGIADAALFGYIAS